MKTIRHGIRSGFRFAVMSIAIFATTCAWAQGTAFTYQGQLDDSGFAADGSYDFNFEVYDAEVGGSQIGATIPQTNVPVEGGLFTVELDFGSSVFTGSGRWLEIGVQTNGGGGFTVLSPRTKFTSTPYAIAARSAQFADTVPTGSIGSSEVINNSLTSSDLGPNSVGSSEVINNSLTSDDLGADSVGASELAANSVYAADIVTGAVGASEIATGAVSSPEVLDNSLQAVDLAANSVTASEIAANAVGTSEVADGSLTGTDLADNTVGSDQLSDAISLGSDGVNGYLYLYSSDSGSHSINLSGGSSSGGRLWLFNNDGYNGVWMAGGSGNAGVLRLYNTNGSDRVEIDGFDTGGGGSARFEAADGSASVYIRGEGAGSGGEIDVNEADGSTAVELQATGGGKVYLNDSAGTLAAALSTPSGGHLTLYDGGGISVEEIDGSSGVIIEGGTGGYQRLYQHDGNYGIYLDGDAGTDAGGSIRVYNAAGAATITLDGDYAGDGRIITQELQITGGSDLSEQFDITRLSHAVEPGMIVCIDADHPGKLEVSTQAYDRKVAGIVSGADGVKPGLLMGQDGTIANGEYPVALTGRVFCKCDTAQGAIEPGDLITTSSVPGHGMKVVDHTRAQGAIIGKAMTPLDEGQGMVLVLVSLQ